jgi:S1-C subfamily serine protease
MEFVDGEPLTEVLIREKVLNHMRASDVISQIAEALAAAHSLGILHRDLKPDNVMIARTRAQTDLVKLLDFGIARVMGRETQHFTSTGLVVGTPEWMSPEQIAGDQLTVKADIYALGLIAFRALTGEGAFGGATSQEVLLAKMTRAPRQLSDVRPDVEWSQALQDAMDRVLANNPADRYDDALIFAADFYAGVSQMPMTPDAEAYLQLLSRGVTPVRVGTLEATPPRGIPTMETPAKARPPLPDVPQLAHTVAIRATNAPSGTTSTGQEAGDTTTTPTEATPPEDTPAEATPAMAVPAESPTVRMPFRRSHLLAVGGLLAATVLIFTVMQAGGGSATAALPDSLVAGMDSGPASDSLLAAGDSLAGDSASKGDSIPAATDAAAVASRPATPALDRAAARSRGSIFTVSSGRRSGAGFLADTSGVVLTSSSLVTSGTTVDVYLDAGRRVLGRVALVDSAQGLAALVVPTRHCPSACAPIRLAPDRAGFRQGDTVMAVLPPTLLSSGARAKGTLTNVSARGLAASVGIGAGGAGAPVFLPDGNVIGVARGGDGRSSGLVPASAARAFLRSALAAGVQPIDSILPSWPARPVSAEDMAAAVRRTSQDLERFRVPVRNDFEALVMTPQVLVYRRAEADTMRKYFNPGSPARQYCDDTGFCDPIEAWTNLETYVAQRRGVVVIQVAPSRLAPPRRGERAVVDMNRRPALVRVVLTRDGQPIHAIEAHRIYSVINPTAYPEGQRDALYSVLLVFGAADLLEGSGPLEIQAQVQGSRDLVRLSVPGSVIEAVRADLASTLR